MNSICSWYILTIKFFTTLFHTDDKVLCLCISYNDNSPVSSGMMPIAVVILPGTTSPLRENGMVKLRSNVSNCSAILSIVTGTLIVVVVAPAVKVAVIGVEV